MTDDILCPPVNVPAAIASIQAKLSALEATVARTQSVSSDMPEAVAEINARLNAMDRATVLLHQDYTQVPTELDRRASQLEQVFDAKIALLQRLLDNLQKYADTRDTAIDRAMSDLRGHFTDRIAAVDLRFTERDIRFAQASVDHQKAIDAALASVNLSSEKNERSFTKQIDGLQDAANKSTEGMGKRIDDLKKRLIMQSGTSTGISAVTGWVVAGIMTITAVVTTMVALYNVIHKSL